MIPLFYKRIQGKNIDHLKIKGPVIIAMNHPNAFTDPVLLTYLVYPQRISFLARGDAFKPGLVSWILEKIGIVPIFRIQDGGREGLKKNEEAYRTINALLGKNSKIVVFAEGGCVQERRLRPLKKGVARMIFGAYEALNNDELVVVPVCVNYSQPDKFRSTAFYNVGDPIYVKDFMAEYHLNPARANSSFLQYLEPKMRELLTHINDKKNDHVVCYLEELSKRNLLRKQHLDFKNLEHDFLALKQLTDLVNQAAITHQDVLDEFKTLADLYFIELNQYKLKDWLIDPERNKQVTYLNLFFRSLVLVFGFPIYALGLLGNYLPLLGSHTIARKTIKSPEFYSSIALCAGMLLFLINYGLWFFVIYHFSPHLLMPLLVCFSFFLCGWLSLFYYPFMLKTFGIARVIANKALQKKLSDQRIKLLSLINKF